MAAAAAAGAAAASGAASGGGAAAAAAAKQMAARLLLAAGGRGAAQSSSSSSSSGDGRAAAAAAATRGLVVGGGLAALRGAAAAATAPAGSSPSSSSATASAAAVAAAAAAAARMAWRRRGGGTSLLPAAAATTSGLLPGARRLATTSDAAAAAAAAAVPPPSGAVAGCALPVRRYLPEELAAAAAAAAAAGPGAGTPGAASSSRAAGSGGGGSTAGGAGGGSGGAGSGGGALDPSWALAASVRGGSVPADAFREDGQALSAFYTEGVHGGLGRRFRRKVPLFQVIEFHADGTAVEPYRPVTPQQLGLHPRDVVLFAPSSRLAAPQRATIAVTQGNKILLKTEIVKAIISADKAVLIKGRRTEDTQKLSQNILAANDQRLMAIEMHRAAQAAAARAAGQGGAGQLAGEGCGKAASAADLLRRSTAGLRRPPGLAMAGAHQQQHHQQRQSFDTEDDDDDEHAAGNALGLFGGVRGGLYGARGGTSGGRNSILARSGAASRGGSGGSTMTTTTTSSNRGRSRGRGGPVSATVGLLGAERGSGGGSGGGGGGGAATPFAAAPPSSSSGGIGMGDAASRAANRYGGDLKDVPYEMLVLEVLLDATTEYFYTKVQHLNWMLESIAADMREYGAQPGVSHEAALGKAHQLIPVQKFLTSVKNDVKETCAAVRDVLHDREALHDLCLSWHKQQAELAALPPWAARAAARGGGGAPLRPWGAAAAAAAGSDSDEEDDDDFASSSVVLAGLTASGSGSGANGANGNGHHHHNGHVQRRPPGRHVRMLTDMLESYEREIQSLEGSINEAEEDLDNTRALWHMQLDSSRNHIIMVNLWLSMLNISVMAAAVIPAWFGMNLSSGLNEGEPLVFYAVCGCSLLLSALAYPASRFWYTRNWRRANQNEHFEQRMLRVLLVQNIEDVDGIIEAARSVRHKYVDRAAFRQLMLDALGPRAMTATQVDLLWQAFDRDRDGFMEAAELLRPLNTYKSSGGGGGAGAGGDDDFQYHHTTSAVPAPATAAAAIEGDAAAAAAAAAAAGSAAGWQQHAAAAAAQWGGGSGSEPQQQQQPQQRWHWYGPPPTPVPQQPPSPAARPAAGVGASPSASPFPPSSSPSFPPAADGGCDDADVSPENQPGDSWESLLPPEHRGGGTVSRGTYGTSKPGEAGSWDEDAVPATWREDLERLGATAPGYLGWLQSRRRRRDENGRGGGGGQQQRPHDPLDFDAAAAAGARPPPRGSGGARRGWDGVGND